jgi:ADP-ribosylglycohydrolase
VTLPVGLVLEPERDLAPDASAVHATPVPERAWEEVFAPGRRRSRRHTGYRLVIDAADIERCCGPAAEAAPNPDAVARVAAFGGCLLGTAVGDALGLPFEGIGPRRLAKLGVPPLSHRLLFGRGMISDDTEHTCINAQALARSAGEPALPAGIGLGTLRALVKLCLGVSPERSGVRSAGNGPMMRSAILGVFAAGDPQLLRELVGVSTRITHSDPRAERAALCVARAAAWSACGEDVDARSVLAAFRIEADDELESLLGQVERSLAAGEGTPAFARSMGFGKGVPGYCYATLAVVLHAWLAHPRDFPAAITAIVCCGGDSDTTAAIAGGIVGAGVGSEGIPEDWRAGLRDWPRGAAWMHELARDLAYTRVSGLARSTVAAFYPFTLLRNLAFMGLVLLHGFRRLLPPY